ncbi:MAG: nucleotidyltransferase family protein [Treponema sp.]|jgi:molybdenum cofactor cytidylyltransferase|nr:nucleotidyltransferase family protein [Treponema sp.]
MPSETYGLVAAVLMASGFSSRFGGQNKLLFPFRGKPLAQYALELVSGMDFSGGIYFIAASDDVAALAAEFRTVRVIKNTAPERDLSESVRLGVEACPDAAYYLFFPCDMPFLDADTVRRVLDEREPGCIVEPRYKGKPGNPCLFSAVFREELLSLKDGETPRLIKTRHPEAIKVVKIYNPVVLEDIDDEDTLKRLLAYSANG